MSRSIRSTIRSSVLLAFSAILLTCGNSGGGGNDDDNTSLDCPITSCADGEELDEIKCLCIPDNDCRLNSCPNAFILNIDVCQCIPIVDDDDDACSITECPTDTELDPEGCSCIPLANDDDDVTLPLSAAIQVSQSTSTHVPVTVTLSAVTEGGVGELFYEWDIDGDNRVDSNEESFESVFTTTGEHLIRLMATDNDLNGVESSVTLTLGFEDSILEPVDANIGASLGLIDGALVTIPPNSLSNNTDFTLSIADPQSISCVGDPVSPIYQIEVGSDLQSPVSISLPYDKALIPSDVLQSSLSLAYCDGQNWVTAPTRADLRTKQATALSNHFSFWSIFSRDRDIFDEIDDLIEGVEDARIYLGKGLGEPTVDEVLEGLYELRASLEDIENGPQDQIHQDVFAYANNLLELLREQENNSEFNFDDAKNLYTAIDWLVGGIQLVTGTAGIMQIVLGKVTGESISAIFERGFDLGFSWLEMGLGKWRVMNDIHNLACTQLQEFRGVSLITASMDTNTIRPFGNISCDIPLYQSTLPGDSTFSFNLFEDNWGKMYLLYVFNGKVTGIQDASINLSIGGKVIAFHVFGKNPLNVEPDIHSANGVGNMGVMMLDPTEMQMHEGSSGLLVLRLFDDKNSATPYFTHTDSFEMKMGVNPECGSPCATLQCASGGLFCFDNCGTKGEQRQRCGDAGCQDGKCIADPPNCGDGILHQAEQCDDGNLEDGDGCSAICRREHCGDGIRNRNTEVCELHNTSSCTTGDGLSGSKPCRADCQGWGQCNPWPVNIEMRVSSNLTPGSYSVDAYMKKGDGTNAQGVTSVFTSTLGGVLVGQFDDGNGNTGNPLTVKSDQHGVASVDFITTEGEEGIYRIQVEGQGKQGNLNLPVTFHIPELEAQWSVNGVGSLDVRWEKSAGKLIATVQDGNKLSLIDAVARSVVFQVNGDGEDYTDEIAFNPSGTKVAGLTYYSVVLVDTASGQETWLVDDANGHESIDWSSNGSYIAVGDEDGGIYVYRASSGALAKKLSVPDRVSQLRFSPDSKYLAAVCGRDGDGYGHLRVWTATNWGMIFNYDSADNTIYSLAWSPDSANIAIGDEDNTVQIIRVSSKSNVSNLTDLKSDAISTAWSPNGKYIAAGSGTRPIVWDAETNMPLFQLISNDNVEGIDFAPDSTRLVISTDNGLIQVFDLAAARCGNGIVEDDEICDLSSNNCSDGCYTGSENCLDDCSGFDACDIGSQGCGNGVIEGCEFCDDGEDNGQPGKCDTACSSSPCGNNTIDPGELCDPSIHPCCNATCDGVLGTGNVCRDSETSCDAVEFCNGADFECPVDGHNANGTSCSDGLFCNGVDTCLNGICNHPGNPCDPATEVCDEVTKSCISTATCGDGTVQPGEECDDGANGDDCDGCLDSCLIHVVTCGDGIVECGEFCDEGALNDTGDGHCATDYWGTECSHIQSCGDGVYSLNEECDPSVIGLPPAECDCDFDCVRVIPFECGNGIFNGNCEDCDPALDITGNCTCQPMIYGALWGMCDPINSADFMGGCTNVP